MNILLPILFVIKLIKMDDEKRHFLLNPVHIFPIFSLFFSSMVRKEKNVNHYKALKTSTYTCCLIMLVFLIDVVSSLISSSYYFLVHLYILILYKESSRRSIEGTRGEDNNNIICKKKKKKKKTQENKVADV